MKVLPVAAAPFFPAALPLSLMLIKGAIEKGTNTKVADLEKGLINKAMGKEDGAARSLWSHSKTLTSSAQQTVTIEGASGHGDFSVTLEIEIT